MFFALGLLLSLASPSSAASPWDGEWEGQLVQPRLACSPCKVRLSVQDGVTSIRGDISIPRFDIDGAGQVTGSLSLNSIDFSAECALKGQVSGNTLTARGRCIGMADIPQLTLRRVTASTAGGLREDQKLPPSSGGRAGGISGDLGGPRSGSGGIVTTPQREDGRGNPGRRGNPGGIRDIDNDRSTSSDSKGSNDPLSEANAPPLQLQATALFQNSITSNMKSILPAVVEMRPDGVIGSGFVIDAAAGLVLTNYHVVGAATSVNVVFADGEKVRGVVLRRDRARDVALVRVEKKNLRALPLRLGEVTLTEKVYAIGSPFGFSQTISEGIVSAFRKVEGQDMMQATAPISPGNSGGPLVDASGNVIGISTLTYRTGQNLNFFIPIGLALTTLNIKPAGR